MYPGINQRVVKQQSPVALGYPEFLGSPWTHSLNKITFQTKKHPVNIQEWNFLLESFHSMHLFPRPTLPPKCLLFLGPERLIFSLSVFMQCLPTLASVQEGKNLSIWTPDPECLHFQASYLPSKGWMRSLPKSISVIWDEWSHLRQYKPC